MALAGNLKVCSRRHQILETGSLFTLKNGRFVLRLKNFHLWARCYFYHLRQLIVSAGIFNPYPVKCERIKRTPKWTWEAHSIVRVFSTLEVVSLRWIFSDFSSYVIYVRIENSDKIFDLNYMLCFIRWWKLLFSEPCVCVCVKPHQHSLLLLLPLGDLLLIFPHHGSPVVSHPHHGSPVISHLTSWLPCHLSPTSWLLSHLHPASWLPSVISPFAVECLLSLCLPLSQNSVSRHKHPFS